MHKSSCRTKTTSSFVGFTDSSGFQVEVFVDARTRVSNVVVVCSVSFSMVLVVAYLVRNTATIFMGSAHHYLTV